MKADVSQSSSRGEGLVDRTYRALKSAIMSNHYPGNFTALEQELASDLGVSRTPVREALIRLEREGLVEIIPRHGIRVIPVSSKDMREIYQVMIALETQAVRLLTASKVAERSLKPLLTQIERMEAALEKNDLERWATADQKFHELLLSLTGNKRLVSMAAMVKDQAHRTRMATLHQRPLPLKSNRDHRRLVEAIADGDGPLAAQIHDSHLTRAMETLCGILQDLEQSSRDANERN